MPTVEHKAKVPPELLERADQTHMTLDELSMLDALATAIYGQCQDAEEARYFVDYFKFAFANDTHPSH